MSSVAVNKPSGVAPTKVRKPARNAAHAAAHPPWIDMIKACITSHPEDARVGVSRPTIKKFVETTYHLELNATAASQLKRAIVAGNEKGTFTLPKGPSGKIKLTPKVQKGAAKENASPFPKKSLAIKGQPSAAKSTKKPSTSRATNKSKPKSAATISKGIASSAKKSTSTAKTSPSKKPLATKKSATTKKPTAKKGAAKQSVLGKKVIGKLKSKAVSAKSQISKATKKSKPATKAKATLKAKPAAKTSATPKRASLRAKKA